MRVIEGCIWNDGCESCDENSIVSLAWVVESGDEEGRGGSWRLGKVPISSRKGHGACKFRRWNRVQSVWRLTCVCTV